MVLSLGLVLALFALLLSEISKITNSAGTLNVFFFIGTVLFLAITVLITILKTNQHQENNVSFYIYVCQLNYLFRKKNQIRLGIQNRFSFRYLFANTYFVWTLLQIQDPSEENDDQDIAANKEDEYKSLVSTCLSTLFFIVLFLGFDAFFHNVPSKMLKSSFPAFVTGSTLGLFCAFISIMKNNQYQENNVSFYTYINRFTDLTNKLHS